MFAGERSESLHNPHTAKSIPVLALAATPLWNFIPQESGPLGTSFNVMKLKTLNKRQNAAGCSSPFDTPRL